MPLLPVLWFLIYCAFYKHANSKIQMPPSQLRFSLPSIINMYLSRLSRRGGGEAGHGGSDLTFLNNLPSISLPTGKSFQSIATKFTHPGLHFAVKYPKAEPNKRTIKISPNKTLQSLFILRCCITSTCSVTATIIHFNHNPCYTA